MNTLLLRRRGMGAHGSPLPYDAEIEYLQCSGTQYINTDYKPNGNTIIEWSSNNPIGTQLAQAVWGCRVSPANTFGFLGPVWYYFDKNSNIGNSESLNEFKVESGVLYKNGYQVASVSATTSQYTIPIILFGWFFNGGITCGTSAEIGKFKIIEDGETILDYIAVRKNGVGFFYDRVSGELIGNQGTGDFILGPDV